MKSLQPLREALQRAVLALGRTEKLLIRAARHEATMEEIWREACTAGEALNQFDAAMIAIYQAAGKPLPT